MFQSQFLTHWDTGFDDEPDNALFSGTKKNKNKKTPTIFFPSWRSLAAIGVAKHPADPSYYLQDCSQILTDRFQSRLSESKTTLHQSDTHLKKRTRADKQPDSAIIPFKGSSSSRPSQCFVFPSVLRLDGDTHTKKKEEKLLSECEGQPAKTQRFLFSRKSN